LLFCNVANTGYRWSTSAHRKARKYLLHSFVVYAFVSQFCNMQSYMS